MTGIGYVRSAVAAFALTASTAAIAADALKFGDAPFWVAPIKSPPNWKPDEGTPIALLFNDQQVFLEPGKRTIFSETAIKIQTAQGLAAGNISVPWDPATDTVTVNKLKIRRGVQLIDVLATQQFTTIRRESNLELAMLDGRLTANIQPEGLQVGDVIEFAATIEHVDPVMKGHVEAELALWQGAPTGLGRARIVWPSATKLNLRQSDGLPKPKTSLVGDMNVSELSIEEVQPQIPPSGAPIRFHLGRTAEASDFATWSEIADLLIPLYKAAAAIPPTGPLRDEVERIRTESVDPAARVEKALALVQDRVRYVALLMGNGGYLPTSAESTWARRFGDCKAKTALLMGVLRELGIEADPVAVHSRLGDAIPGRLPMLGLFDHVLVRAKIDEKTYWLDGTRTGDKTLGRIQVPSFHWGLPLVANAELVPILPEPLTMPNDEQRITINAKGGIYSPATVTIDQVFRGDTATFFNTFYSQLAAGQRELLFQELAKKQFDTIKVTKSSLQHDAATGELRIAITGEAKLKWDDGWYYVPSSAVGYKPDFDRTGSVNPDAPIAVSYPSFEKRQTIVHLPAGFAARQKIPPAADKEKLAGYEFERTVTIDGDSVTVNVSERSLVPEYPFARAKADEARLRAMYDDDIYLRVPGNYQASEKDVSAMLAEKPVSAAAYLDRGLALFDRKRYDEAISDFTESLKLEPSNAWALANRGLANVWKKDFAAATKDLQAAEAIDSENPVAARARGVMAQQQGDLPAAVDAYSKSLRKSPNNEFALTRRGFALLSLGKADEAMKDFDAVVAQAPSADAGYGNRAMVLAGRGKFDAAQPDAEKALALNAENIPALLALGMISEGRGVFKEAVESYSRILEVEPGESAALLRRASAYRALGDTEKALADAEAAIKSGAKDPHLRLLRANIFRGQGKRGAAILEADLLVKESPELDFAQVAAARIYATFGEKQKAMAAFDAALSIRPAAYVYLNRAQIRPSSDEAGRLADIEAALKLEPDNTDVLAMKAVMLSREDKYVDAIQLYDQVLAKAPNLTYAAAYRAVSLFKAGRTAEAEKSFAELRAKAKTAEEFNNLCWAKATANIMLESAASDCMEALRLKPDTGPYLDSLGMVRLRQGKLDEALAAYDQAISKNTGSASLLGRAMVYLRKGDKARANSDRAQAIKLNPDAESEFAEYGLTWQ